MIIFPAIDIKDGKCVRLTQGDFDKVKIFSDKPYEMAQNWEKAGAKYIHLVDLDGALDGELKNRDTIKEILNKISIPAQIGGGIRNIERIQELLDLGISRVILGTAAIKNPEMVKEAVAKFGADKIVIGIDAKNGKVAIKGWVEVTEKDGVELAIEMKKIGIERIIYTDIAKDGMMSGINIDELRNIAIKSGLKVVASGGVSSIDDIKIVKENESIGIEGVITGKAIYEGKLDLYEALKLQ